MAMRPLASSARRAALALGRWIPGLMIAAVPGAALAQYMALTQPPQPDAAHVAAPDARKAPPSGARPVAHAPDGPLPNQRTGPMRQRVVRDICIGCDR